MNSIRAKRAAPNETVLPVVKIAYIAAGAAGMYCGNCLRDHALALAIRKLGEEMVLVPIYTPLRTDLSQGEETRDGPVFFNGVRAYLQQHLPYLRKPRPVLDRMLSSGTVNRLLAVVGAKTDASGLGPLTHSMLRGEEGNQAREIDELLVWLRDDLKPDIIHLSNVLLVGLARRLREELKVPVVCSLQSEDHFIDELEEPHKAGCIEEIRTRADELDGLVAVSAFYRETVCEKYGIEKDKVAVILPGIPLAGHPAKRSGPRNEGVTIGYLARLTPEKGLEHLCEAFRSIASDGNDALRLSAAGYFPGASAPWLKEISLKLKGAGVRDRAEFLGTLDRREKLSFLSNLDIFSVPARRPETKGLYAMEAMASGIPFVLPGSGVFPEIFDRSGGGLLYEPGNPDGLRSALAALIEDDDLRDRLGREGREAALDYFNADRMARDTMEYYRSLA